MPRRRSPRRRGREEDTGVPPKKQAHPSRQKNTTTDPSRRRQRGHAPPLSGLLDLRGGWSHHECLPNRRQRRGRLLAWSRASGAQEEGEGRGGRRSTRDRKPENRALAYSPPGRSASSLWKQRSVSGNDEPARRVARARPPLPAFVPAVAGPVRRRPPHPGGPAARRGPRPRTVHEKRLLGTAFTRVRPARAAAIRGRRSRRGRGPCRLTHLPRGQRWTASQATATRALGGSHVGLIVGFVRSGAQPAHAEPESVRRNVRRASRAAREKPVEPLERLPSPPLA